MKKLYLVKQIINVMFVSDSDEEGRVLDDEARFFLDEYWENGTLNEFEVQEVTSLEQIPSEWRNGCLLYGTHKQDTPEVFLNRISSNNTEYQEYLRLKEKFE